MEKRKHSKAEKNINPEPIYAQSQLDRIEHKIDFLLEFLGKSDRPEKIMSTSGILDTSINIESGTKCSSFGDTISIMEQQGENNPKVELKNPHFQNEARGITIMVP